MIVRVDPLILKLDCTHTCTHSTLSYCVVLTNYLQHWTKINKPVNHSVEWLTGRCGHAATCVSGPLLMIVGGKSDGRSAICDCWIHDLTTMKWKKVICVVHVYQIL